MDKPKKVINVVVEDGIPKEESTGKELSTAVFKGHYKTKEYRVIGWNDELATGVHINQYEKTAIKFLEDLKDYNSKSTDIKRQIDISNKMFRFEDVVSTGTEILIDFSVSKFQINGLSDKLKPLIEHFQNYLNKENSFFNEFGLDAFMRSLAFEYFISGNIFPAELWSKKTIDGKKYDLPLSIKLLNPMYISMDNTAFKSFDQKLFYNLNPKSSHINELSVFDILDVKTNNNFKSPIFLDKDIQEKGGTGVFRELNNKYVSHIKRKARDYEMWGSPYLTKLAQSVMYKQKLWQLDMATVDGLVNYITVFKVGSSDPNSKYHIVSRSRLQAFASLLRNPQAANILVWAHDIEQITTGPDGKVLSFSDRYKEANRAIIQGLGVPPILIDGTGTATAAWTTVIALNKRLEIVRDILGNYINHIIVKIAKANGLDSELTGKETVTWFPSDLRNEAVVKNLLLAFHDRGLLPKRTTLNQGGYNADDIIELKLEEQDENLDELFSLPDNVPFTKTKDPTPGKPSDVVNTDEKTDDTRERSQTGEFKFAKSVNLIEEKYRDDVSGLFDKLEDDLDAMAKKSRGKVEELIIGTFVRMDQIAQIFSTFEEEIDNVTFASKLTLFHQKHIDNLNKFVKSSLLKVVVKQIPSDEKDLLVAGILSKAKKRASMFVTESLKNIELAKTLTDKQKEGYIGAFVNTNPDTNCEYCAYINGNYMTLTEIFDNLPAHPHQSFGFNWQKENPITSGKHKNKSVQQSTKNKSRKL